MQDMNYILSALECCSDVTEKKTEIKKLGFSSYLFRKGF